ncbi:MAG TPA: protocatechuate 3,4-dioxygenase [Gammaproteobacteria bacterium]|jgi:protocatechuate 4,5-dioxygenase, beta chain|nr:protocatechuate 3,4-dioxygenase [Pseudomonadota bacterium]HAY45670.1 protocatechuate 3,4-dioxygenase [Gammaproteobacteria bacterium]
MAKLIGGIGTSHVPAIGAAVDHGKQGEEYWKDFFTGIEPVKEWIKEAKPDVCIIVYNDHASAYSLENISTFAIGVADEFEPADEGYGPRDVPIVKGHSEFAWHIAESLIFSEFDMTISNNMPVDHGLTVPLSVAYDQPSEWPCRVIPIAVNVIQYPAPTANRCYELGKALRMAIDSYDSDIKVAVFGTGGMSHQLQGERAGLINRDFDERFLDDLVSDPAALTKMSHTEYIREAGAEGIEMVMWLVMRGAMDVDVDEKYRFYHVPVSNTAYGLTILENCES